MNRPNGRPWFPLALGCWLLAACEGEIESNPVGMAGVAGSTGGTPPAEGGSGNVVGFAGGGQAPAATGGTMEMPPTCGGEMCGARQECQQDRCVDVFCDGDEHCPETSHCGEDGRCADDVCVGGEQRCEGNQVYRCTPNGSAESALFECSGSANFESICEVADSGLAGCTCEDDWDCPEFTVCDVGTCTGTGMAATCRLDPVPFDEVLPSQEFYWGGSSSESPEATGSAFPESAQVVSTPVVINLDDDNGDGLINELDFPEILFMTYRSNFLASGGVVRAVHGGGPDKGSDYFALCGGTHWPEDGSAASLECGTDVSDATARPAGSLAAGDLNDDGVPEIVVARSDGGFDILDNRGVPILSSDAALWPAISEPDVWAAPAPAIANLDFDGPAEIIVGNVVVTLRQGDAGELSMGDVFVGQGNEGTQDVNAEEEFQRYFGPVVCVADLVDSDAEPAGLEIVAGATAYRLPTPPDGVTAREDCEEDDGSDFCQGILSMVWDGAAPSATESEGFCAVADVLGADAEAAPGPDNPLDGVPEVVLIVNGQMIILNGVDGSLSRFMAVDDLVANEPSSSTRGGSPNIDDFDGDGFPEIATALQSFYAVIDLQDPEPTSCPQWTRMMDETEEPPGNTNVARQPGLPCGEDSECDSGVCHDSGVCTCSEDAQCNTGAVCSAINGLCACLHNGWVRRTEDDSSKASSSSVFDFNGDGAAEVVYNDECYFRVYDGATGAVHLALPSLSRTIIENPVVADVDNDGNAEIVTINNNELINAGRPQCSVQEFDGAPAEDLPNGLAVWGDASDTWVPARRIWNQHSYHVTNVQEGGGIPLHEPDSWRDYGGRFYNIYRSQPRSFGVAPDLTITGMQVSSPGSSCGDLSEEITIVVSIQNQGDSRVGPGVDVSFFGIWLDPEADEPLLDANGDPIVVTLDKSLNPGAVTFVQVTYNQANGELGTLPDEIRAVVDSGDVERECKEDNNELVGPVESEPVADLRLQIDSALGCSPPTVDVTVFNDGAASASNVVVQIYYGDPSQGGQFVAQTTIAGPIEPGESAEASIELPFLDRDVTVWGVADPAGTVGECNEANNVAEGPRLLCYMVPE